MRWLFLAHLVAETGKVPATCRGDAVERGRAEGWIQASACRALPHSGFWVSPFWIDQFFPDLHAAWNHHDPHGSCCRIWRPRQLLPPHAAISPVLTLGFPRTVREQGPRDSLNCLWVLNPLTTTHLNSCFTDLLLNKGMPVKFCVN